MITQNFLRKYNAIDRAAKMANTAMNHLNALGLTPQPKLQEFIDRKAEMKQTVLEYMYSFLPKELKEKLGDCTLRGAFVTDATGEISFSTDMSIHTKDESVNLIFDNETKKLYINAWTLAESNIGKLIESYGIEKNPKFSHWIVTTLE